MPPGGDAQSGEPGGKDNHGQSRGVVLLDSCGGGVREQRAEREGGAQGEPGLGGQGAGGPEGAQGEAGDPCTQKGRAEQETTGALVGKEWV